MKGQASRTSRRALLAALGSGLGLLGLRATAASASVGHVPARTKRLIVVFLNGGLSQVDTFDPKPALARHAGELPPPSLGLPTGRRTGRLLPSPFRFLRGRSSGLSVSEIFPLLAGEIDRCCVVRSMTTPSFLHEPSLLQMNTGWERPGRPSLGSWISYGLGDLRRELPSYVVLTPDAPPHIGRPLWGSAFLPGRHAGLAVTTDEHGAATPVPFADPQAGRLPERRRALDLTLALDRLSQEETGGDPALEGAIEAFEDAFRMQTEAAAAFDVDREPESARSAYGSTAFGRACLTARRLAERGVPMVQVYFSRGNAWDHHDDITLHRRHAAVADQPIAALLRDLRSSGLDADTTVLIATEFGRTPMVEVGEGGPGGLRSANGRDHNPYGFSIVLAGAGIKKGIAHGATDDLGFRAVDGVVDVNDLHATLLHLMGFDHERLTFRHGGRDVRLTDVGGRVVAQILA